MNPFWLLAAIAGTYLLLGRSAEEVPVTENIETQTNLTLPERMRAAFLKFGPQYGVNPRMLAAIAANESSGGTDRSVVNGFKKPADVTGSRSSDGKSWGVMQLTLATARDFNPDIDAIALNNPETSIEIACQLLAWLQDQFSVVDLRFTEWVVKSYNQGVGNTKKEIGGKPGFANEYWSRYQRNYERVGDL